MTPSVTITQRTTGCHCHLTQNPEVRGCGRTPEEALGDMLMRHAEEMGLSWALLCEDEKTGNKGTR